MTGLIFTEVWLLCQDGEMHGQEKHISAQIALLEYNVAELERGPQRLRYTAYTPDHAALLKGNALYRDTTCIWLQLLATTYFEKL